MDYVSGIKPYCHLDDFRTVICKLLANVIATIPITQEDARIVPYREQARLIGQEAVRKEARLSIVKRCQEETRSFRESLIAISEEESPVRAKQMAIFNL